jgi:uncharacterized protein
LSLVVARAAPRRARHELLRTWALCLVLLAAVKGLSLVEPTGILAGNLAGVAAFLFVILPERRIHGHGERWSDFGFPWWGWRSPATWRAWLRGAGLALATCAVVFPFFFAGFWVYGQLLPRLPPWLVGNLAPYLAAPTPGFRLPQRFPFLVVVQFLVVALPEELFYRGWMQTTWAATDPERKVRVLGASLGAGFLWTQLLFAVGHLVVLQVWRLGTFLPGLLFGWLRERSGGLAAPVIFHALANVFLAILEASFYRGG